VKVVICTLPYMPPKAVYPLVYPVDGNKSIEYDRPVRCPVNAILAKTLKKGEQVRVIYILTNGENSYCEENKEIFITELKDINLEIGAIINFDTIDTDTIELEFLPTKRVYNKLITDLKEKIPENAELYTDITYGFKPEILSLLCALRFVEEFRNVDVKYLIYGKVETKKGTTTKVKPMIYDITSLYYLFKLIGSMDATDEETASNILKDFFAL
jgi:hypothetical protein